MNTIDRQRLKKLADKKIERELRPCRHCGVEIPLARRMFAKGITRCVDCQEIIEIKRGKR